MTLMRLLTKMMQTATPFTCSGTCLGLLLGSVLVVNCWAQSASTSKSKGDEIAPFRLTGNVEGSVVLRYNKDDSTLTSAASGVPSQTGLSGFTEEVNLMTRGYIYHPNLLSFEIDGGPVWEQSKDKTNGVVTDTGRQMYNLNVHATVLREKPYTGSVFFNHLNETQIVGPAQSMQTESTRYGFDVRLRNPVTRFPVQFEFEKSENQGSGSNQIQNDRTQRSRLTVDADLDNLGPNSVGGSRVSGSSTFQFDHSVRDSISGAIGLPILPSNNNDDRVSLDTRLKLGTGTVYELYNSISAHNSSYAINQGPATQLNDKNVVLDLRARPLETLQTNARYNYNSSQQGIQSTTLNAVSAGVNYQPTEEWTAFANSRYERTQSTQLNSKSLGADGSLQLRKPLRVGQLNASANLAINEREQQANAPSAAVILEPLTLAGFTYSTLRQDLIDSTTLVVTNLDRTVTFRPGLDYELNPLGLQLQIRRTLGSLISDPQNLLVDYQYATGGSYTIRQFDEGLAVGWSYKSAFSVNARRALSNPKLISGSSTAPINPVRSTLYDMHLEWPVSVFSEELVMGGNAEREYRDEVILPYTRKGYDIYAQMNLPMVANGSLQLGKRYQATDYRDPLVADANTLGYSLRLSARVGFGAQLNFESTLDQDNGVGTLLKRYTNRLSLRWRKAKLQSTLEISQVRESQGATESNHLVGQFMLQRRL